MAEQDITSNETKAVYGIIAPINDITYDKQLFARQLDRVAHSIHSFIGTVPYQETHIVICFSDESDLPIAMMYMGGFPHVRIIPDTIHLHYNDPQDLQPSG